MKRNILLILALLMGVIFFALPAIACIHQEETRIEANCEFFTIYVSIGDMGHQSKIEYFLELTPLNGGEIIEVEGSFPIPELGDYVGTYKGYWGDLPCGNYSIVGSLKLISLLNGQEYGSATVSQEILDCPCDEECGPCDGKVTQLTLKYLGSVVDPTITVDQKKDGPATVEVLPDGTFKVTGTDKKGTLGTEISIYVNGALNTKIHTSCSQPIGPGMVFNDFEVVEGYSLNGGLLCEADYPQEPPDTPDCGCRGKVTQLTLQYNGSGGEVEVTQKKKKEKGTKGKGITQGLVFSETLGKNDVLTINGMDKKGTLGPEIIISVGGIFNTKIHTSCSQPIGPGMVFGDFLVIEGYSREGGLLCPEQTQGAGKITVNNKCKTCRPAAKSADQNAESFSLAQNYPNPFNPVTTISFSLPHSSNVTLAIYNVLGEKITTLVDGEFSAGNHSVEWNAGEFSSGIYFYRIEASSFTQTNRMMLVK